MEATSRNELDLPSVTPPQEVWDSLAKHATSIIPLLGRTASKFEEMDGSLSTRTSLLDRQLQASLPRQRTSLLRALDHDRPAPMARSRTSGGKRFWSKQMDDVLPWSQEWDARTGKWDRPQRQNSLLDRVKRTSACIHSPLGQNENGSFSLYTTRKSRARSEHWSPHFAEVHSSRAPADWIGFTYGDKDMEPCTLSSFKRRAVNNVKNYIAQISVPICDDSWSAFLSPVDFDCLRNRVMEPRGTGQYTNFASLRDVYGHDGVFRCRGCANFLFVADEFVDRNQPWATFRTFLPAALAYDYPTGEQLASITYTCRRCRCFVGVPNPQVGGIFACSQSIHYHAMSKTEVDIIRKLCARKLTKLMGASEGFSTYRRRSSSRSQSTFRVSALR